MIVISSIKPAGPGQMEIQFVAPHAARSFQMQYKDDLLAPAWTDVAPADGGILVSTKDGETLTFLDKKATSPQRFYRVKQLFVI